MVITGNSFLYTGRQALLSCSLLFFLFVQYQKSSAGSFCHTGGELVYNSQYRLFFLCPAADPHCFRRCILSVFSVFYHSYAGYPGGPAEAPLSGAAYWTDAFDLPFYFYPYGHSLCYLYLPELPSGKQGLPDVFKVFRTSWFCTYDPGHIPV